MSARHGKMKLCTSLSLELSQAPTLARAETRRDWTRSLEAFDKLGDHTTPPFAVDLPQRRSPLAAAPSSGLPRRLPARPMSTGRNTDRCISAFWERRLRHGGCWEVTLLTSRRGPRKGESHTCIYRQSGSSEADATGALLAFEEIERPRPCWAACLTGIDGTGRYLCQRGIE